jgi:hypothetical protein
MGSTTRYEVWKLERSEEGIGYKWAIWDQATNTVAKSGLAQTADDAVEITTFWIGFLTDIANRLQQQKR